MVLGGVGFIGRNFVKFCVDGQLCSKIRVADKSHPGTSYLSDEHKAAFDSKPLVQYIQSDLSKDAHVARAFADEKFDYVFNLCGETRFGLPDQEYKKKSVDPALKCATAAAAMGSKFIEISTAQVYNSDNTAHTETSTLTPWTTQALNRLESEEAIKRVAGLAYVILRPAIVYGPGDQTGLSPRLTCAAAYKVLDEKMKFLWSDDLKLNVVHVSDVCRAMWLSATRIPSGSVYNLADTSNLDQGSLNKLIEKIFTIRTGFHGYMASSMAQMALETVANGANEKHMEPWLSLCKKHNIETNLSPYIDKELLKNNHLCVDGTKLCRDHHFIYSVPLITEALLRDQLNRFVAQKLFPPILS